MSWHPKDFIIPSAQEINGTGETVGSVVKVTIHSSHKQHNWAKFLFQVLKAAQHVSLSVLIVRSGDIIRISAPNPPDIGRQTTQGKI